MRYLTVQEIIAINTFLIQHYSPKEQLGVKDRSLLESATYHPWASAFEEDAYPTFFSKVAALFESLAQNHAFFNGNKRTAFTSLTIFLRYNGYQFDMPTQEAIELTVNVVKHHYTLAELTQIIQNHVIVVEE